MACVLMHSPCLGQKRRRAAGCAASVFELLLSNAAAGAAALAQLCAVLQRVLPREG